MNPDPFNKPPNPGLRLVQKRSPEGFKENLPDSFPGLFEIINLNRETLGRYAFVFAGAHAEKIKKEVEVLIAGRNITLKEKEALVGVISSMVEMSLMDIENKKPDASSTDPAFWEFYQENVILLLHKKKDELVEQLKSMLTSGEEGADMFMRNFSLWQKNICGEEQKLREELLNDIHDVVKEQVENYLRVLTQE